MKMKETRSGEAGLVARNKRVAIDMKPYQKQESVRLLICLNKEG